MNYLYFTATSWFPGNVRVKPHSKNSALPPPFKYYFTTIHHIFLKFPSPHLVLNWVLCGNFKKNKTQCQKYIKFAFFIFFIICNCLNSWIPIFSSLWLSKSDRDNFYCCILFATNVCMKRAPGPPLRVQMDFTWTFQTTTKCNIIQ